MNRPEDEVLEGLESLRSAFAELPDADPGTVGPDGTEGERPTPETIWAAVHGELAPEDAAGIIDRLHRDPQLALEWRLALALDESEPAAAEAEAARLEQEPEGGAANDRRYWLGGVLGVVAAAAVVLIVLADDGSSVGEGQSDSKGTIESSESGPVLRAGASEAPISTPLADGAALPREAFVLRWSAVPEASGYEVRLTTEALDPVHRSSELDEPMLEVPAAALTNYPAGTNMLWRVEALLPDGRRVASTLWRVQLE